MRVLRWGWVALVLSCKSTPTVAVADPVVAPVRVPDGTRPSKAAEGGFVVLTGEESYLVPLDPAADLQRYPGWFIGQPGGAAKVHFEVALQEGEPPEGAVELPYCVDALEEDACGRLETTSFVDADAVIDGKDVVVTLMSPDESPCDCVSVEWLSDEGSERFYEDLRVANSIEEEELQMAQYEDVEAYIRACYLEDLDYPPVAYLGGVGQFHDILSHVECGGSNSYALQSESIVFREGARLPEVEVSAAFECYGELDASLEAHLLAEEEGCAYGEDECCPDAGEGTAVWIVSGVLLQYAGDAQPVGGSCGCLHRTPISPETCPSAYDPCGGREDFSGLSGAAWWVSTDGSAGLNLTEAGDLQVFERGTPTPTRVEELGLRLSDIVGIEVLPELPTGEWTPPELAVVQVPKATGAPGRSWGNLCFERFKEGKLELAEAACVRGLLETHDDDKVRGALTYSLGRIEEAQGHQVRAGLLYERSLRLRPGHAAVQARLEGLK